MPNIKSAKKRVIVNGRKTEQNKAIRSEMRTAIKKVDSLVKENNVAEAKKALDLAFKCIDSAVTKNIIHANNAANKKAKLAKKVYAISKDVVEEVVAPAVEEAPAKEEAPAEAPVKKPRAKKAAVKEEVAE